ncbi:extracellular solute-binding protein [Limibacillus sp. MBR-115]|jgi:microcin C transport system substrate-binding protein|uniref:extracellular solute-binding protein n=1 Tax=Limibacillus sp. MBR-115 TaxID=3156465 RepID=UPI003390A496
MSPTRRFLFPVLAIAAALLWPSSDVTAQQSESGPAVHKSNAIAMHGEPKYGPDFKHFDYVNPEAPKGGSLRLADVGAFDSFNNFIIKGEAAAGIGRIYDSLMESSADEAFTEYCLLCESVEWPDDRSWVAFTLRDDAYWHDGKPITVEDVIFSLDLLRTQGHPFYRFYYGSVASTEITGPRTVRFTFSETGNRELPLIIGQLSILPKHYWETRDFSTTTLEPPLGSGPYKVESFEPGRFVTYKRVENYWARDLPVQKGRNNWDEIRYDYYRDDTIVREALKGGDIDLRVENQAKAWAVDYDVQAVRDGKVILAEIPNERPTGMQSFAMNTRRAPFDNRLVRRALAFAFDFEWTNRNLFFSQYTRTESYFSNSELASRGLPTGAELEILESYRDSLPPEVFTETYSVPSTDGSGWPRDNLRQAFALLEEAGWVVRDMKMVNAETGKQMGFEILLSSPAFERIVLPYIRNLRRLGIDARVRLVDSSQYVNRIRSFEFDMIVGSWGQSDSPGNEQRNFWGCQAAESPGSRNLTGVCDPVVDSLIEQLIAAPDRESLVATTRALDRVLLWGHYVVPNWHIRIDRIAYWDIFGQPEIVPKNGAQIDSWWIDRAKADKLSRRRQTADSNSKATE